MDLRKILAAALSLTMVCSAATTLSYAPVTAYAADPVAEEPEETTEDNTVTYPIEAEVDGCKYSVYEDHAVFTNCPNIKGDFVIPAEVNGVPVTKIEERAFSGQSEIVSVTFPATVTEIGGHLAGYTHIEKYLIDGNSKTFCSVDGVIFTKDMKKLVAYPTSYNTKTYTVPDGVETIGDGSAYTSDIESLILPDSVTEVENFAYTYCKQLKSIKLSKNLKSIGYSGFGNCKSLESADVPASVEKLGTIAFASCTAMKTLTINNPNCKIADFKPNDDVVIRGYESSTAQAYAEKNGLTFEVISGEPPVAATTTAVSTTATAAATTTTSAALSAETPDLKYATYYPIQKIIGDKPYEVRLAGLYSVSGAKVLDESVDAGKVADIKSGVIASLTRAAQDVDFTASEPTQAAAIPFIEEKAISWFNDNYASLTGYKLTALSIKSFTVSEQAASVVTGATTTSAVTTTTTATSTASVATTTRTGIDARKFIYAIQFVDADTKTYINGVQFTIRTNDERDGDYGTVASEGAYTTLQGYGDKFTLTIVAIPAGYSPLKTTTFTTETVSDLVMSIYIAKDGTAYLNPRQSSETTTSVSEGTTTTATTTTAAPETTTEATTASSSETTTATTTSPDPYNPLYVGDWHLQTTGTLPYSLASMDATASNNGAGSIVLAYTNGARSVYNMTWKSDGDNVTATVSGVSYSAKYDSETDSARVSVGGVELVFVRGKSAQTTTSAETASTTTSESAETATETTTTASETSTTAASTTAPETTSTTPASVSDEIAGTWKFSGFTDTEGKPSDMFSNTSSDLVFSADGTGKFTVVSTDVASENDTFTWTAEDDTVTVIFDNADDDANMIFFTYKDGELTFEREDGTIHFNKEGSSASKLGDVNGDGAVDAKDASAILAEYSRLSTNADPTFTDAQKKAADVNNDGNTDAKDASAILAYYSFLSTGGKGSLEEYLAK